MSWNVRNVLNILFIWTFFNIDIQGLGVFTDKTKIDGSSNMQMSDITMRIGAVTFKWISIFEWPLCHIYIIKSC